VKSGSRLILHPEMHELTRVWARLARGLNLVNGLTG
jgi:hypothetical protein